MRLSEQLNRLMVRIGTGCLASELTDYENKLSGLLERQGRISTHPTGTDWHLEPATHSRSPRATPIKRPPLPDEPPF